MAESNENDVKDVNQTEEKVDSIISTEVQYTQVTICLLQKRVSNKK